MFKLTLVTPEKRIETETDVKEITVPAFRGELNILEGHSPMMTTLSTGVMRYQKVNEELPRYAAISWGYCQVSPEGVNVLAELAEPAKEIDAAEAVAEEKSTEQKLSQVQMSDEEFVQAQRDMAMARARQDAAAHAKTSL